MKRYISLILVAAVLVCFLAVPSYAVEDQWFDVLDYTTPNNSGSNMVTITTGSTVSFDVPVIEASHFDFVLQFQNRGITNLSVYTSTSEGSIYFNIIQIDDYTYRCYGYVGLPSSPISLSINFTHSMYSTIDVNFLSFKLSEAFFYSYDLPVNGSAYFHGNINSSFTYNGSSVGISIPGASLADQDDVRIYLDIYDWAKYDYLELYLVAREMSVNSIAACLSSEVVPCSVSYLNSVGTTDQVYITVSVDLTGVSRNSAEPLDIAITGTSIYLDSNNGYFGILFASGYLENAGVSKFAQLRISLSQWFNNLRSGIVTSVNSLLQPLNNIVSSLDSGCSVIVESLNNIYHNITSVGSNIVTWGSHIHNALGAVESRIVTWGQNIVDALVGQKSDDSTISDAIENQEQVNQEVNLQLQSAVGSWSDNVGVVTQGFNLALTNATPALIWLSGMAQNVFSGMGWFGNIFFFLGFLHVFFLLMSKSGLGRAIDRADKRGDD